MMRLVKVVLILCLVLFVSCVPMTKEKYMSEFKEFIDHTRDNNTAFSDKDWETAERKFQKYNTELYERFKDELTFEDKVTIANYRVQYNFFKHKEATRENLLQLYDSYQSAVDDLKEKVQPAADDLMERIQRDIENFIENDLAEGLNVINEQAQRIGNNISRAWNNFLSDIKGDSED